MNQEIHQRNEGQGNTALAETSRQETLDLATNLKAGMLLDRAETRRLLNKLTRLESEVPGCAIMCAQLRHALARKDWLRISIEADPATVRTSGVNIGIVEVKATKTKTRLSPMQKWQQRNGLNLRSSFP